MVRSSILNEEAIVNDIVHGNNVCTVGVTNFFVRINPAGMALILDIDPNVVCIPRFEHSLWGASLMHHACVTKDQLYNLEGFCKVYRYVLDDIQRDPLQQRDSRAFLLDGFPYEIDVKESSPLVGWFSVLQGVSDGR